MDTSDPPFVRTVECTDAVEFLDTISPRGSLFRGKESAGSGRDQIDVVVFRGHADTTFQLIPTALRENGPLGHVAGLCGGTTADQIRAETELVRRFFSLADAAGLPLPEDSQALRRQIAVISRSDYPESLVREGNLWPPNELLSLVAIGQHHGLSTRLLDWTRSYLTAAYFAASGAQERAKEDVTDHLSTEVPRRLSVWAFEYSRYLMSKVGAYHGRVNEYQTRPPTVELVSAPHASNPNLHAQDGVFTVFHPEAILLSSAIDRRPLHTLARETLQKSRPATIFYEITLPVTQARHLMWLLSREGIDASRLFPGYGGVVRCLAEERA
jgi:hypothetical protein